MTPFFSIVALALVAPVISFAAYAFAQSKLKWAANRLGILKWMTILLTMILVLGTASCIGTLAYQLYNACDDMATSPAVANARGAYAQGRLQVCTFVGTVENHYIVIRGYSQKGLSSNRKLVDYSPVGDRDPIMRWTDDNTLSVDLGEVLWVSSPVEKVGGVRIIYSYSMSRPN